MKKLYRVKYTSNSKGAGIFAFEKLNKTLPTIRSVGYPHELSKSAIPAFLLAHAQSKLPIGMNVEISGNEIKFGTSFFIVENANQKNPMSKQYTKAKSFASARANAEKKTKSTGISHTAFTCFPTMEQMRKGKDTYFGYVEGVKTENDIYKMLNGISIPSSHTQPCLIKVFYGLQPNPRIIGFYPASTLPRYFIHEQKRFAPYGFDVMTGYAGNGAKFLKNFDTRIKAESYCKFLERKDKRILGAKKPTHTHLKNPDGEAESSEFASVIASSLPQSKDLIALVKKHSKRADWNLAKMVDFIHKNYAKKAVTLYYRGNAHDIASYGTAKNLKRASEMFVRNVLDGDYE